jgi:ketosteroid isomerase-like protein
LEIIVEVHVQTLGRPQQEVAPEGEDDAADSTRAVLESVFSGVAEHGFGAEFRSALSDDLVFTVTGSSPLAGRYAGRSEYVEKVLDPLHERLATPLRPRIEQILADGETGVVLFRTEGARGRNGADFSMRYCWVVRVVDGSIVEITGFYDSKRMCDLFA